MALIDRVKERIETDLSDAELAAMIDEINAEITRRYGPNAEIIVELAEDAALRPRRRFLYPQRAIDEAQSLTIVEVQPGNTGGSGNETMLAADDYRIMNNGRLLERLIDGTNGRMFWAPLVRLTYTPVSDSAQRDGVVIELVQLAITYRGLDKQERAGDYQRGGVMTPDAYEREREAVIGRLAPKRGLMMA